MTDLLSHLLPLLEKAELFLTERQLKQLNDHFQLLLEWNQRISLTTITDPSQAAIFHYLDALAAAPVLGANPDVYFWVDVGSGGGFPGIPLAIMFPVEHFILTDGQAKKGSYLQEAVGKLDLKATVTVYRGRVEAGTLEKFLPKEAGQKWGILARALERMEKQIPKLLKLPGLHCALFWVGKTEKEKLLKKSYPNWTAESLKLPSGENRFLVVLHRGQAPILEDCSDLNILKKFKVKKGKTNVSRETWAG